MVSRSSRFLWHAAAAALCMVWAPSAPGQEVDDPPPTPHPVFRADGLVRPASPDQDRLRLAGLRGHSALPSLLGETRTLGTDRDGAALDEGEIWWLPPTPDARWNSGLAYGPNDGSMWGGRGWNQRVTVGGGLSRGILRIRLLPEITYHQNADFQTLPNPLDWEYDRWASPWHTDPESLDLPSRFGGEPFTTVALGQSAVTVAWAGLEAGLSASDQWWGPGVRNAIVLSSHAGGLPRAFLRTDTPLPTRAGPVEFVWFSGRLDGSGHFLLEREAPRSISAAAVTWSPWFEPALTVGATRVVFAPGQGGRFPLAGFFDVFRDVGRPNDRPVTDPERPEAPDEIFSLFARWALPADGAEVYGEWARSERPKSFRDLLARPGHSQGYTLGGQWSNEVGGTGRLRIQGEVTTLEQDDDLVGRREVSFYKSRVVPQGYTHRGRVVGAAIGPGASSQWLAIDYLADRWGAGLTGSRIRWENDTMYNVFPFRTPVGHDVSLLGGVRAHLEIFGWHLFAHYEGGPRLNYLFQNESPTLSDIRAVDVVNHSLRLSVEWSGRAPRE
jgi:hypothetical protein